jgi:hypothetical protein
MNRTSLCQSFVSLLAMLVAVSAVPNVQADGHVVKAFKIKGAGVAPDGLPLPGQEPRGHWIRGEATGLGHHCGEGTVRTDWAAPQPDGTIAGEFGSASPFVFRGEDGDRLVVYYGRTDHGASKPGTFVLTILDVLDDNSLVVEAAWIAEFVAVTDQCTGKFRGVTGSWIMYAYSKPFVLGSSDPLAYSWEGKGELTFPKGKKK